jgi:hypothetical protein
MSRVIALAAVALLAGVATASAQDSREGMYAAPNSSGDMMVFGPDNMEGSPLMMGANGKPADCPPGTYYEAAQNQIMSCDDDEGSFMMSAPAEGTMMPSGEAWPEGAMNLEYREGKVQ